MTSTSPWLPSLLVGLALSISGCSDGDPSSGADGGGEDGGGAPERCLPPLEPASGDGDGDGVADADDVCFGYRDGRDGDGDGVPDGCDLCAGAEDAADEDGDGLPDDCDATPAEEDWVRTATVGGLTLWHDAPPSKVLPELDELAAQGVTVVEADSDLSLYLNDAEFERELELMEAVVGAAHRRGMRLVWYYPTLESITDNGRNESSSMFKDHPEWVQRSIGPDAEPNVFYGDEAFWVDPDDESAWLDPLTGYRDYFLERVRRVAATGLDGIWFDVPLLNDIVGRWTSHTPEAKARFLADTGYEAPTSTDPADPAWWAWVRWRHEIIAEFLDDAYEAARDVNPSIKVIVENVTLDYNASLLQGLDGTFSPRRDGLLFVWEVDVTSESDGMIFASTDDWISLISMMKFGRGVFEDAPSWAFTYGNQVDDAEMVLAEAVASQNSPYELKAPEMTTTVGGAYRTRVFSWIQRYRDLLFRSESSARVAVLHSSASRDFVDGTCLLEGACGLGLYASTARPEGLREEATWWAEDPIESLYTTRYLAEYRGLVKALVHLHRPFDIVPLRRAGAERLAPYSAVLVPDLQAVSDAQAEALVDYVEAGGRALFTGPAPARTDEAAVPRLQNPLDELLDPGLEQGACEERQAGQGSATFCRERTGKAYLAGGDRGARDRIDEFLAAGAARLVETDAPDNIHFEAYRRRGRLLLHAVNFTGARGAVTVEPQTFEVAVDASELPQVCRVIATSPRGGDRLLPFSREGDRIVFELPVEVHTSVILGP